VQTTTTSTTTTTNGASGGTWRVITHDTFDLGTMGNYTTVGDRDAQLSWNSVFSQPVGSNAPPPQWSFVIRDNSLEKSSFFHTLNHNVTLYTDLRVSFRFYARTLANSEDFFVEYSSNGGASWSIVKQYVVGIDFTDSVVTTTSFLLSQQQPRGGPPFPLTSTAKLRFRCDAVDNEDMVYIDDIVFEGLLPPAPSVAPVSSPVSPPVVVAVAETTISIAAATTPTLQPVAAAVTTRDGICPLDRRIVPARYEIQEYPDRIATDKVEDDLSELSYLAFSSQTDANGNRFAYAASDKEQFSLKVIRFTESIFAASTNANGGIGTTVATYTLNLPSPPLNDDWEDMSLGPCTDTNTAASSPSMYYTANQVCIYIGNIGNNIRTGYSQRSTLSIFKFVEPPFVNGMPQSQSVNVATIQFSYGTGFDPVFYDGTSNHKCK
jgi:hypothetical protein